MPQVTLKVNGTYESIVRPVALGVLRDVMAATGMEDHNVESTLLGEFGLREQAGSKMGEGQDVSFGSTSKATVTVEDNIKYEGIMSTHTRSREHPPILEDRRLGIGIYPIYIDSELTLHFRYTAANKEEALKWRDDYKIKRAEERHVLYHEIFYYIPIQDGVFQLLHHLHTLRENISGYGDCFVDYIDHMRTRELTTLTGVDGDTSLGTISVPEKQIQVTGWFDFNEPPKEEKDQGGTRWNIEFTYKCMYKRCTHLYIKYPMAIHQQHISPKYFEKTEYFSYEEMKRYPGIHVIAHEKASELSGYNPSLEYYDGIRFPQWDDWLPRPTHDSGEVYFKPMLTWMIGLNPKDPKKLFDLTTMPELRLGLETDSFMRRHHEKLTTRRKSIIYIRLFKDDIPVTDDFIYVDKDLVVRSVNGLDLRHLYHLRLHLVTSARMLDPGAIDDLRKDPDFSYSVIKTLDPKLDDQEFLDNLISDKIMDWDYIVDKLNKIETSYVPESNLYRPDDYYPYPSGPPGSMTPGYTRPGVNPGIDSNGPWSRSRTGGLKTVQSLLIVSTRDPKAEV